MVNAHHDLIEFYMKEMEIGTLYGSWMSHIHNYLAWIMVRKRVCRIVYADHRSARIGVQNNSIQAS